MHWIGETEVLFSEKIYENTPSYNEILITRSYEKRIVYLLTIVFNEYPFLIISGSLKCAYLTFQQILQMSYLSSLLWILLATFSFLFFNPLHGARRLDDPSHSSLRRQIETNANWQGGTWPDPTETQNEAARIGRIQLELGEPVWSYAMDWGNTKGTYAHSGKVWAEDAYEVYVVPAGQSNLVGQLSALELLGGWDFGSLGTPNRPSTDGWGVTGKPLATTNDPLSRSSTDSFRHRYRPVSPPDEASIVKVTWGQKYELRGEVKATGRDVEMDVFVWVRPIIATIDGADHALEISIQNQSVTSRTRGIHVGGKVSIAKDGPGGELSLDYNESQTFTDYDSLRASFIQPGLSTLDVTYSVQAHTPSNRLTTRHTFEWVCSIDDNNTIGVTTGLIADSVTLDYKARINSDIKPRKIVLIRGTGGKDFKNDLPGFSPPQFRNFNNDTDVRSTLLGNHAFSHLE